MTSNPAPLPGFPAHPGPAPDLPGGLPAAVAELASAAGISDAELVRRTLAGQQDPFAALVARYQKRAFWIAFHVVGRVEDARDVAQEAFVRLYRSLESYDFARSFGVPTAVLRMSCIYGERQMGTEDQGWVAHFLIRALEGRSIMLYGDGHQVRDVLHVGDAVAAYIGAWRNIGRLQGRAFNLGGGPDNAVSLRRLLDHVSHLLGREVDIGFDDWRPGDQRWFVADTRAIDEVLALPPKLDWRAGVERLADWLAAERGLRAAPRRIAAAGAR